MNIALILSGGTGARAGGDIPKQYIKVCGKPVICYCIERLSMHAGIDKIQIVADVQWHSQLMDWLAWADQERKFNGFSMPGVNRQLSIWNGLQDIKAYAEEQDHILIHDGARPMLSSRRISECLEAIGGHEGALPVLPMKDTIYASVDGSRISSLLNRDEVFAGQTPEVFLLGAYYEANRRLRQEEMLGIHGSTEPAVMAGMDVVMIHGDETNFKITTRDDLERFQEMVSKGVEFT